MSTINLLPWRDDHLLYQNRKFGTYAVIAGIFTLILIYGLSIWFDNLISKEQKDIQYLQQEIGQLNTHILEIQEMEKQRKVITKRIGLIQNLQSDRHFIVKLFDNIAKAVPNGLYLTELIRDDNSLQIAGMTESNSRVSLFMRNLERFEWPSNTLLREIVRESVARPDLDLDEGEIAFRLNIVFDEPEEEADNDNEF